MQVLITFAEKSHDWDKYPLAVVLVQDDGTRGQEHLVCNVREGRIFGNGMCSGLLACSHLLDPDVRRGIPINTTLDERLLDVK